MKMEGSESLSRPRRSDYNDDDVPRWSDSEGKGGKGKGGKEVNADGVAFTSSTEFVSVRLPHEMVRRKENIKRIVFEDKLRLTDYWAQCDRLLVNEDRTNDDDYGYDDVDDTKLGYEDKGKVKDDTHTEPFHRYPDALLGKYVRG